MKFHEIRDFGLAHESYVCQKMGHKEQVISLFSIPNPSHHAGHRALDAPYWLIDVM